MLWILLRARLSELTRIMGALYTRSIHHVSAIMNYAQELGKAQGRYCINTWPVFCPSSQRPCRVFSFADKSTDTEA